MKKIFIGIISVVLISLVCRVNADIVPDYIKYQTINKKGEFVKTPQTKDIEKKEDYLTKYKDANSKLYGFKKGDEVIIPAKFDNADYFFMTDYASASQNKKWGIIDKQGSWLIEPVQNYRLDYNQDDDIITVNINNKWGIINKERKWIIEPFFDLILKYNEGLAMACKDDICGFIDKEGQWTLQSNQYRPTCYEKDNNGIWQQNDRCGVYSIFSDGLASVYYDEEKYVSVLKNDFLDIYQFYIPVFDKKNTKSLIVYGKIRGKNFYINSNATEEQKKKLTRGYIITRKKSGYINKNGELVLKGFYGNIRPFQEGLAAVSNKEGKWGYIDKKGKWIIKPQFEEAYSFYNGYATVELRKTKKEMKNDELNRKKFHHNLPITRKNEKIKEKKLLGNKKLSFYGGNKAIADEINPENIKTQKENDKNIMYIFSAIILIFIIISIISLNRTTKENKNNDRNG
ncbi:WG repeat-containing protein [bacterium]|nr:WG repeat-containing protein [bacterium]